VRCLLFQVLHTLELLWEERHAVHYDLHTGNVMVLRQSGYLFYSRNGRQYLLSEADMDERVVKLIDFGRSCLLVDGKRLGPIKGYENTGGYGPSLPSNPCYDVREFFFCLFIHYTEWRSRWWQLLQQQEEIEELNSLIERACGLKELEIRLRLHWTAEEQRAHGLLPGHRLTLSLARTLVHNQYGVFNSVQFFRSPDPWGLTPSQALDDSFFHALYQ